MGFLSDDIKILSNQKIWDGAAHHAFTDLIYWQGRWLCTFRESDKHDLGINGCIRIITSTDGSQWESIALLSEKDVDLRDPKLSEMPDGRLMLLLGGSVYSNQKYSTRQPRVTFSSDGKNWTPLSAILKPDDWLWRLTWHNGRAYGASYRDYGSIDSKKKRSICLYESDNGLDYRLVTVWKIPGHPNETTVRFLGTGQMVALVRRTKPPQNTAWIGIADPPFTDWQWHPAAFSFGGPNFLVLPDNTMWASGRIILYSPYGYFPKTCFAKMQLNGIHPLVILSSQIDTSYPGMVYRNGEFWISYYSGTESKSAIYLARLNIRMRERG